MPVTTPTLSVKDSIAFMPTDSSQLLFKSHLLKPTHKTPIFNSNHEVYWTGIVLFAILSLYVLIKISDSKKYMRLFDSMLSLQNFKQNYRDENKISRRTSFVLLVCYVFVIALFLTSLNAYFNLIFTDKSSLFQFANFALIVASIFVFKLIINLLIAFVSDSKEAAKESIYTETTFKQLLGIVLFPFTICLFLSKYPNAWFLYPCMIFIVLFSVIRFFRSFMALATEQNIGIVYILLYFCALEILPLLIIVKFLLTNF